MLKDFGITTVSEAAGELNCDELHLRRVLKELGIKCIRVSKTTWIFSLPALSGVLEASEHDSDVIVTCPVRPSMTRS